MSKRSTPQSGVWNSGGAQKIARLHDNSYPQSDPSDRLTSEADRLLPLKALPRNAHLRILVVDDDTFALQLISNELEAHGFTVAHASGGLQALAMMDKQFYSVLLTDLHMPQMDGMRLTRLVRAQGMTETYIIMLTMGEDDTDYERGYAAGVDDYVIKRKPDSELLARLNAALDASELRRSLKKSRATIAALKKSRPSLVGESALDSMANSNVAGGRSQASEEDIGASTVVLALTMTQVPKVLLVDDDEIMMERLRMPMVDAGYDVSTASNGADALRALEEEFRSVVILDRNMPGVDGLTLCREIRERSWPGYVYVMLLTSRDTEEDVLTGLDAGADDYLSKRVSDAHLIARLSTASRILSLEQSLKHVIEERRRLAMTDPLTGAPNRRYFTRYLGGELKRARRFGADLSILVLDIDFFKRINDRFGHACGDLVLQQVVKCIQSCLPREYDWCARLGGEEFAVVLPQTNLAGASVVAEKVRRTIEETPVRLNAEIHSVTVSIGVSGLEGMPTRDATTVESLVAHADKYLYDSKNGGRNRVSLAPPGSTG